MHIEHTELASFNVLPVMKFNVMWVPPKTTILLQFIHTHASWYVPFVLFFIVVMISNSRIIVLVLIKCNCVQTKQQTTHYR